MCVPRVQSGERTGSPSRSDGEGTGNCGTTVGEDDRGTRTTVRSFLETVWVLGESRNDRV